MTDSSLFACVESYFKWAKENPDYWHHPLDRDLWKIWSESGNTIYYRGTFAQAVATGAAHGFRAPDIRIFPIDVENCIIEQGLEAALTKYYMSKSELPKKSAKP